MLRTKHLFLIFIPALLFVGLGFFIRIVQYQPLYPKEPVNIKEQLSTFTIALLPADPILGDKKAPKTIIAFEDFGCTHCKETTDILEQIIAQYPSQVKVIWKGLPVTRFPINSRDAHQYAFCANQQGKFQEYMKFAFANSQNLSKTILDTIIAELNINQEKLQACLSSGQPDAYITQTEEIARSLNVQAVPALFVDNKQIQPPATVDGWKQLLGLQ